MSRGGRRPEHAGRQRTCIGCRQPREPAQLVRLALASDGIVVDARRRLPGRGAWLCRDEACARKGYRQLGRALRLPGLPGRMEELLELLAGRRAALGAGVSPGSDAGQEPPSGSG